VNNFKLEPGDILVNVNDRNDPFSRVKRWLAGSYEQAAGRRGAKARKEVLGKRRKKKPKEEFL